MLRMTIPSNKAAIHTKVIAMYGLEHKEPRPRRTAQQRSAAIATKEKVLAATGND